MKLCVKRLEKLFLKATLATAYPCSHQKLSVCQTWCHHSRFVSTFVVVSGGCRYFVKPSSVDVVNVKNICPGKVSVHVWTWPEKKTALR